MQTDDRVAAIEFLEEVDPPDLKIPAGDLWVFAYGSLMWNPGFPYVEARDAKIYGFHRSLCVWSWVYRGTRAKPGLVFGLDVGGSCIGRAYRVRGLDQQQVVDYLYRRELVSNVYTPRLVSMLVQGGSRVSALTFTVKREHQQYAGKLAPHQAVEAVRAGEGTTGPSSEYLTSTLAHLEEMGIVDRRLRRLADLVSGTD